MGDIFVYVDNLDDMIRKFKNIYFNFDIYVKVEENYEDK